LTLRYLLDTNVISEATRPIPNPNIVRKLTENQREIATAAVVLHELLYGCLRLVESRKRQFLLEYINQIPFRMPILSYDPQAAQ